ncbi:anaerobic ribonucleoside-triphosphate reductase [Sutterella sp.]|uniref:anaerobic ribonucleoside-triphosphate reductase n=1 Tax=Sutterella sp. TaxID=1981025 RepID=UPI0026DF8BF6|nr:anaerobic ribonucleoside-triphosphate reductase [Sutterella sp.]MDO5531445.1 anaerobic ribonucleoside-triphosphate reductase [Sutterella sp.]
MTNLLPDITAGDVAELDPAERTPCEVWTRVMGYHRPIASFNIGKKGEAAERLHFTEHAAASHPRPLPHEVAR